MYPTRAPCSAEIIAFVWQKFGICQTDAGKFRQNARLERERAKQDDFREKQRRAVQKGGSAIPPPCHRNATGFPTQSQGNA